MIQQATAVAAGCSIFVAGTVGGGVVAAFWPWPHTPELIAWLLIGAGVAAMVFLQSRATASFSEVRPVKEGEKVWFPLDGKYP